MVCCPGDHHPPTSFQEQLSVNTSVARRTPAKTHSGALELVSPIFSFDSSWLADTGNIFSAIQKHCSIQDIPQCSTHVHVSQAGRDFSPFQLAALSKAILAYEACFDSLVPADRASAYWCQSNRWNPVLSRCQALEDCLDLLDVAARHGTAAVVEAMCVFPASSAYGRAHGRRKDFVHGKVYKWNLARLLGNDNGRTIEFRQPPGSHSAEDAVAWVLLTTTFVAGATGGGNCIGALEAGGDDQTEFWHLLCHGAEVMGLDPFLLDVLSGFITRNSS